VRFSEKRVLVTGAGSGIGRATAVAFASEGAHVLLADINGEGLEETLKVIGNTSGNMFSREFDAAKRQACFRLVEEGVPKLGGLDILCNIAGLAQSKHFTEYTEADWQAMLGVNLSGVFYLCQAALPALLDSGGNIVNMASSAGLTGQAYQASYCATKGGVVMLSKALAMEYAKRGVRVNALCPGSVNTPLIENYVVPEGIDYALLKRLFPLLATAQPEEVASAVLYLASNEARYITGVALPIDGGQTAG
jgi:meso-butanediol dehydrogenase/(S,S)-butanediol dehydrogenase/diacetyl reductase